MVLPGQTSVAENILVELLNSRPFLRKRADVQNLGASPLGKLL
jgi:hypothetical protein